MKSVALPPPPRHRSRTAVALSAATLLGASLLAACASGSREATATRPLDELLKQAEQARAQGEPERARLQWQQASRAYPADKQPWLHLAEDYFRSGEHGNAIVAAQEAMQRDPQDRVAQGILAVSGLRVSTVALVRLREHAEGLPGDTRSEAATLTRLLRDTLGEPVLVPPPEPAATAPARNRLRPARATATKVAPATATAPATAVAASAAAAAATAATGAARNSDKAAATLRPPVPAALPAPNPFDRLR
ncbi:outer membrane protein assembly factor BamD [Rubrivivax gelatinosus]|uniref:hypothetical protein n=1 Tax=Rubrivivax gelatinosus TaxID=28068 RepID=UPI0019031586|nr:hypothetical protein [Rubrivivax gelatinosus]